jgi:hypothetical protein
MTVTDCWKAFNYGMAQSNNHKKCSICEFADMLSYELLYNSYADNFHDCTRFLSPLRRLPRKRKKDDGNGNDEDDEDDYDDDDDDKVCEDDEQRKPRSSNQVQRVAITFSNGGTHELSDLSSATASGSRVDSELFPKHSQIRKSYRNSRRR